MRAGQSRPVRRIEVDPAAVVDRDARWARIPAVAAMLERVNAYFLRAETAHGFYTYLEDLPKSPDRDLHERSHGEGFLELVERKFVGYGCFLMDEPEAPLSFTSTLGLLARLDALRGQGSQVVVATHSPLLTALPGATVLELGGHGIRKVGWQELAVVDHWRRFLDRPGTYLDQVLRGD